MLTLQQISEGVLTVADEFPLKKAELFGSYAEGRSREDSDIDLLVEFDSGSVSLLTLNRMKRRLEELLKTDVDIIHGPLPADSMLEIDGRIALYGA